jgi:plastocyanin
MLRKASIIMLGLMMGAALLGAAPKPAAEASRQKVTIKNLAYAPASITIKAGTTVLWTNSDDRDHTVTAADGSFTSGNLSSGQTYEHTFSKAGTYPYGCKYHPRMKGTVVVQ